MRVLVMTDHMPWGHRAIARAIYGYLHQRRKENGLTVDYAEVKAEMGIANDLYKLIYRLSPSVNRLAGKLMNNNKAREMFEEMSRINMAGPIRAVAKYRPDLVISTYFYHTLSLARWRKEEGVEMKLWTVVADPWSIIPVSFVKGADLHLVYDEVSRKKAEFRGISGNKILETGWWVRPEMYQQFDRNKERRKMGFDDERTVIFVGGGSLGTNGLPKVLPLLLLLKKPVGMVFNSGTDKLAFGMVEQFTRLVARLGRDREIVIKNYGWIENMAQVLAGCDLVLGKAGPNFLFDCVAAEKPFVAITHVGGQEDGNIELIEKKRIGWVREKTVGLARFLNDFLERPDEYRERIKDRLKAEGARNKESLAIVERRILAENKIPPKA